MSSPESAKMVSLVFLNRENSDSKSSSTTKRLPWPAHLRYSCFFEADAVTPEGKLR